MSVLGEDGNRRHETLWMNSNPNALYSMDGIYGELVYGSPHICHGLNRVWQLMWFKPNFIKGKKILCVGSGIGWEIVAVS